MKFKYKKIVVPGIHLLSNKIGKKALARSIVPIFRKEFSGAKKIKNATLYISGLGQYEASINGIQSSRSY